MRQHLLVGMVLAGVLIYSEAESENKEIRVDQFDKNGQRQGYYIIHQKSGRIDQYDKNSKRIGSGQIQDRGNESNSRSTHGSKK